MKKKGDGDVGRCKPRCQPIQKLKICSLGTRTLPLGDPWAVDGHMKGLHGVVVPPLPEVRR